MEKDRQNMFNKFLSLSLTDKLFVIEHVLCSVRKEYQQDFDDAIKEVLCVNASFKSRATEPSI